jgi:hypothetical protein
MGLWEALAWYATWPPVKVELYKYIKHAPLQVLLGPAPWMWICDKIPPEAISVVLKARFPNLKAERRAV